MKMSEFSLPLDLHGNLYDYFPEGCLLVLVGNSHLHWGWVSGDAKAGGDVTLWDTPHLATSLDSPMGRWGCSVLWEQAGALLSRSDPVDPLTDPLIDPLMDPLLRSSFHSGTIPLVYASVVPSQTVLLQGYPLAQALTLGEIPLPCTYPTLGVDRALALWTAGECWGWPAIVIDGGTALTLTGGNEAGQLVGGAILPGLGLQLRSLFQHTAALPLLSLDRLPDRWACNTPDAILSGIAYTLLAGMRDFLQNWLQTYPQTQLCFTGGDGQWLYHQLLPWLTADFPVNRVTAQPHLGLWGMLFLTLTNQQRGF